ERVQLEFGLLDEETVSDVTGAVPGDSGVVSDDAVGSAGSVPGRIPAVPGATEVAGDTHSTAGVVTGETGAGTDSDGAEPGKVAADSEVSGDAVDVPAEVAGVVAKVSGTDPGNAGAEPDVVAADSEATGDAPAETAGTVPGKAESAACETVIVSEKTVPSIGENQIYGSGAKPQSIDSNLEGAEEKSVLRYSGTEQRVEYTQNDSNGVNVKHLGKVSESGETQMSPGTVVSAPDKVSPALKPEKSVTGAVSPGISSVEDQGTGRKIPKLYPLSQLLPVYILAEGEDGLYIVDQHAAHERVLYEECLAGQGDYPSQYLLIPETLELEHSEAAVATDLLPAFNRAGFVIDHFGGNTFLLRGAPSYIPAGREKEMFLDMLDSFKGKGAVSDSTDFLKRLAASVACKGAVKAGEKMPFKTMEALLERLSRTENPFTCPHGRPTVIHLSFRDLRARFLR
ncbi:MAG: hypothetical protein FWD21_03795, partial [Peptococcaceae bacterium]|nr:hypothetical protein [Peptococcaceae bacterium]